MFTFDHILQTTLVAYEHPTYLPYRHSKVVAGVHLLWKGGILTPVRAWNVGYWRPGVGRAWNPTLDSSSILVSQSQPRQMGLPLGEFPTEVGLHGRWWITRPVKIIWHPKKKKLRLHLDFNSDGKMESSDTFSQYIVIKSLEEILMTKLLPFLIKKKTTISTNIYINLI